ncbi:MAG: pantoate--beta-alanine ligase [Methyloceanibacter sp.]
MPKFLPTVRTVSDLRARVAEWRQAGETVALVPTMGALHAGHLSLIDVAKRHASRVVVSIFVNPIQFGPREDLTRYPRDEAGDMAKLAATGAQLVYAPSLEEMYPPGFATKVSLPSLTQDLCGAARPNHFEGVSTVVTKLLNQCAPHVAVFGEKDYQQLLIIKRLVRDLNLEVEIAAAPIVREDDGLALSSRNAYLSPAERKTAPILFKTIGEVASGLAQGRGCDDAAEAGRFKLEAAGFRVDYVAVRDPDTLEPLSGPLKGPARVLAAAHLSKTRLIDNIPVPRVRKQGLAPAAFSRR